MNSQTETTVECGICDDTGWIPCSAPWCADLSHYGICTCPEGQIVRQVVFMEEPTDE
jgi:hypothetical protein